MKIVYDAFANKSVFLGNYTLRAEMRNYLINRYFAGGKSSRPCDIIIEGKKISGNKWRKLIAVTLFNFD